MGAFVNLNLAKTVISDCDFGKRFDVEFFLGGNIIIFGKVQGYL